MITVLSVEDDASSRILLEKGLGAKGFRVLSAADGIAALEILEQGDLPDIILSDIMMPRLDGYALCRILKQRPNTKNIPFIFYSATFVGDDEVHLGLEMGAEDYLIKPVETDELSAFLKQTADNAVARMPSSLPSADVVMAHYNAVLSRKLEKKVAELEQEKEKRAKTESKFGQLIDELRHVFFFYQHDLQGRFTFVSPSVQDILGYSENAFLKQWCKFRLATSDKHYFFDELPVDQSSNRPLLAKVRHRDGSIRYLELSEHPVFDNGHELVATEGIAHDVTELKALEQQFLQAQKMEALGTLVGGIAHDFNNVLSGMMGAIFLAEASADNREAMLAQLANANALGLRAADMIKQLLAFARQEETDKTILHLVPFLDKTMKLIRTGIEENIAIEHHTDDADTLYVSANTALLQQILFNLVNNARDAVRQQASPKITITLSRYEADTAFSFSHQQARGTHFARIDVQDNGQGISEDALTHIFEPFFTTKSADQGTGLGLAMVRTAIHNHHGAIEVSSHQGEGSCFSVYLPLEKAPLSDENTENDAAVYGHGETLLLIDDDPLVLNTTQAVLENLGYHALVAHDGQQAMDVFMAAPDDIALVITDLVMPGMGGVELVKRMRCRRPELPVIYLTGYDSLSVLQASTEDSTEPLLHKPCCVSRLSREICNSLNASANSEPVY